MEEKKNKSKVITKLLVLVAIVLVFVLVKPLREGIVNMSKVFTSVDEVREYIKSFGSIAVVISFLMMILQSVAAPIPAFLITFANAAIWGWWKGAILSWSSAMAGAALCFWIARFFGRDVAEKLVSKSGLDSVEKYFKNYGARTILVARLLPFVPFDPVSYVAGLTPMGFWEFFIATGLGQLPATIVYSYAAAKSTNPQTWVKGLILLFAVFALGSLVKKIYNDMKKSDIN